MSESQVELGMQCRHCQSHYRRMNGQAETEKVRVRETSRARPEAPVVRAVRTFSSQQPEDFIVAEGKIVCYCLVN